MKTNKDLLLFGTSLAVLAGLLTIIWLNHSQALFPEKRPLLAYDSACDLQAGPCGLDLPNGGKVWLEMGPLPVKPMRDFVITVRTEGRGVSAPLVDFRGVSMNMGINRVPLEAKADSRFTGSGILPVCVRQRMDWEAQVWLDTPEGPLIAPFRFDTYKP